MCSSVEVHLNYPDVITTEPMAFLCRNEIVARCKAEFGEREHLEWERVIDTPHGSLRILGSRKANHMDHDPAWVNDKAYYPMSWDEEARAWKPSGFYHGLLRRLSIFPSTQQLCEFEVSDLFREMMYLDVAVYRAKIEERRVRKQEKNDAAAAGGGAADAGPAPNGSKVVTPPPERKGAVRVHMDIQPDGRVQLRLALRRWASKAGGKSGQDKSGKERG
ncbi:hypothetical protein FOA52_008248 [Chlamydomonas sp. UWO 241]|nr:hypothetical protein FOA52_008248 [Chlamydomonas sp. UWO 241]